LAEVFLQDQRSTIKNMIVIGIFAGLHILIFLWLVLVYIAGYLGAGVARSLGYRPKAQPQTYVQRLAERYDRRYPNRRPGPGLQDHWLLSERYDLRGAIHLPVRRTRRVRPPQDKDGWFLVSYEHATGCKTRS
jgi:hypothetical protein